MKTLELKIPPPLATLMSAVLMWIIDRVVPSCRLIVPRRLLIAVTLGLVGVAIAASGFRELRRAQTTTDPVRPDKASSLVITGIYRWTRNPMYASLALLLLGWAVFLANAIAILVLPCFVSYIGRFQIVPEERILESKFGPHFRSYRENVRRWI